jgi:hypothetical protein
VPPPRSPPTGWPCLSLVTMLFPRFSFFFLLCRDLSPRREEEEERGGGRRERERERAGSVGSEETGMNHGVVILLGNQQPPSEGTVGKEGGGEGGGEGGWIRKGHVGTTAYRERQRVGSSSFSSASLTDDFRPRDLAKYSDPISDGLKDYTRVSRSIDADSDKVGNHPHPPFPTPLSSSKVPVATSLTVRFSAVVPHRRYPQGCCGQHRRAAA